MKIAIFLIAAIAAICGGVADMQDTSALVVGAQSERMVWNGVVAVNGRIIVSGPRWAGGDAPAVALVETNELRPYPDQSWNAWRPGTDPARAFVNVNAIHLEKPGTLWVVDTGTPEFAGDPLPGAAKAVEINLQTDQVTRAYPLDAAVRPGSYVDDIRINGGHAYLTDSGKNPAIIVLDLKSGNARRVLEGAPAVKAAPARLIVLSGKPVMFKNQPLMVNADPLEVSLDGKTFHFGPLNGPWSQIETRLLDDPAQSPAALLAAVRAWADLPPTGGTVMDTDGSLYFSELSTDSLKRLDRHGKITTIVSDPRLHWVDAPFIDAQRNIWLPVPQLDLAPPFNGGVSHARQPITLYRLRLPQPVQ